MNHPLNHTTSKALTPVFSRVKNLEIIKKHKLPQEEGRALLNESSDETHTSSSTVFDSRKSSFIRSRTYKIVDFDSEDKKTFDSQANFITTTTLLPKQTRSVALVGELHHGKTSLGDLLQIYPYLTFDPRLISQDVYIPGTCLPSREKIQDANAMVPEQCRTFRSLDMNIEESARGVSIFNHIMTSLIQTTSEKSFALHLVDTPGHANFEDQVINGMSLCDAAILVIDVGEGVLSGTLRCLNLIVKKQIPVILFLNKLDRLIIELRLPPKEAYRKLCFLINTVNEAMRSNSLWNEEKTPILHPEERNVVFGSTCQQWMFTLHSFANVYLSCTRTQASKQKAKTFSFLNEDMSVESTMQVMGHRELTHKLWDPWVFDAQKYTFERLSEESATSQTTLLPSFVSFVLEPLYKIASSVMREKTDRLLCEIAPCLNLRRHEKNLQTTHLIRSYTQLFLYGCTTTSSLPKRESGIKRKPSVANPLADALWEKVSPISSYKECEANSKRDTIGHIVQFAHLPKETESSDCVFFHPVVHVLQGCITKGQHVSLQSFSKVQSRRVNHDSSDKSTSTCTIHSLYLCTPVGILSLERALPGMVVFLQGFLAEELDLWPFKSNGFLFAGDGIPHLDALPSFLRERFTLNPYHIVQNQSVIKLGIEVLRPSDYPELLNALRKVNRIYPALEIGQEDTGEHFLLGPGELYLDLVMHSLRDVYGSIEIKVSHPTTTFRETVSQVSGKKSFKDQIGDTREVLKTMPSTHAMEPNIVFTVSPLQLDLTQDLVNGNLSLEMLKKKYRWKPVTCENLWAFGPDPKHGPNILVREVKRHQSSLPNETQTDLDSIDIREEIIKSFNWACREGPLCGEPLFGVKVQLHDSVIKIENASKHLLVPMARLSIFSSIIDASPRIMEPIYRWNFQCALKDKELIRTILSKRRGNVLKEKPVPGSMLCEIKADVPTLEGFGLETDVRTQTMGTAFGMGVFSYWDYVPGDPLESLSNSKLAEPVPEDELAPDILLKTRRRKGMTEEVTLV